jgi:hypothetical protein
LDLSNYRTNTNQSSGFILRAKAAFTPGFRVGDCSIENIDSELFKLDAVTNGPFGVDVKVAEVFSFTPQ